MKAALKKWHSSSPLSDLVHLFHPSYWGSYIFLALRNSFMLLSSEDQWHRAAGKNVFQVLDFSRNVNFEQIIKYHSSWWGSEYEIHSPGSLFCICRQISGCSVELVSQLCQKPISHCHSSSSSTSCCALSRAAHLALIYDGSPEQSCRFSSVTSDWELYLLLIISQPPYSLHSFMSDQRWELVEKGLRWVSLPPPRHLPPQSPSAMWWRWEWVKVLSHSAIT